MRYAVFLIAEVTEAVASITTPPVDLAVKSNDGTKALLKFTSEETVANKTILTKEDAQNLLTTEEWTNDLQARS